MGSRLLALLQITKSSNRMTPAMVIQNKGTRNIKLHLIGLHHRQVRPTPSGKRKPEGSGRRKKTWRSCMDTGSMDSNGVKWSKILLSILLTEQGHRSVTGSGKSTPSNTPNKVLQLLIQDHTATENQSRQARDEHPLSRPLIANSRRTCVKVESWVPLVIKHKRT